MELLKATLHPTSLEDLDDHYKQGKCLVLKGHNKKFVNLIAPQDIERKLNDGCNASNFAQLIEDSSRISSVESNCAWSSSSLRKSEFSNHIASGKSFMISNSSQITPAIAQLANELEEHFSYDHIHADVHLYVSVSDSGNSYNAHRDLPQHKILLQAYGDTDWQIFDQKVDVADNVQAVLPEQEDEYLELVSEFTLHQGDLLYMPPGVFHKVTCVSGPRISISIPFFAMKEATRMDRSYIHFSDLFLSNA